MRCLHVWLCLGRLRKEGEDAKEFSQIFYDAFQDNVERRVYDEGVRVRVRKWLQDLERTFYGNAVSYDKALDLGGAELVKALHRNVYEGEGDVERAKALERYVRHHLASLALTDGDFAWVTSAIADLGCPIISVLEGGYNVRALESAVRAHVGALIAPS